MADPPVPDPRTDDPPAANALSVMELNERIATFVEETSALHCWEAHPWVPKPEQTRLRRTDAE